MFCHGQSGGTILRGDQLKYDSPQAAFTCRIPINTIVCYSIATVKLAEHSTVFIRSTPGLDLSN